MAAEGKFSNSHSMPTTPSRSFERFAGLCAIMVGIVGFLYAVAFVTLQHDLLSALFLMLGGLLSSAVLVAIYNRLRETDAAFALWALCLALQELWARQPMEDTIWQTLSTQWTLLSPTCPILSIHAVYLLSVRQAPPCSSLLG
jgi:hypothetical protein